MHWLQGSFHAEVACPHAETMSITVYMTDAGVKDKGGVEQPAYLNFEAELNKEPEHDLRVSHTCRSA